MNTVDTRNDCELASDIERVPRLAFALDLASSRVGDLIRALIRIAEQSRASDHVGIRGSARASTLPRALVSALVSALARALIAPASDIDLERAHLSPPARALIRALARISDVRGQRGARRVVPSAAGLLAAAARLLPAADRARYAEECKSELWDLAQVGDGRLRQLRYALRQLRNALPLGFALRSPRRRSAAP